MNHTKMEGDDIPLKASSTKNLHDFIKKKLKTLGLTQSEFMDKLYIDRSTYYRFMAGKQTIDQDFINSLNTNLNLDSGETLELDEIILISKYGESTIAAWKKIHHMLFFLPDPKVHSFDFHFYGKDGEEKRFCNADIILNDLFAPRYKHVVSIDLKVINCIDRDIYPKFYLLLDKIKNLGDQVNVTHLVSFKEGDSEKQIDTFTSLAFQLPLMYIKNYSVYFQEYVQTMQDSMFDNSVICSIRYEEEVLDCWMVFESEGESDLLLYEDKNLSSYIKGNFNRFAKQFDQKFYRSISQEKILRELYEIRKSENNQILIVKSNPCFDMIPPDVYLSYKNRCLTKLKTKGILFFANTVPNMKLEDAMDFYVNYERKCYELTFNHKRIDIHSVNGLHDFALSGKLSDHPEGLLAFSKDEVKRILQNLLNRTLDLKDSYHLYITRTELFKDKFFLDISKNGNLFVEAVPSIDGIYFNGASIYYPVLSELFFGYLEHWLIPRYAMTIEETEKFIKTLIAEIS